MAFRDMQTVVYTTDQGDRFRMMIDAATFAQQNTAATGPLVGGEDFDPADGNLPAMPVNLKPRHVIVVNGGNTRKVICLTTTAALMTGADTEIDLQQLGGAALTYAVHATKGESWKRKGKVS